MSYTLAIIKPDIINWDDTTTILKWMAEEGRVVRDLYHGKLPREMWEEFYEEHRDKPYFGALVDFMASGPVVAAILEGRDVAEQWRFAIGATDPRKARLGSIRALYGNHKGIVMRNVVHGSDPGSVEREIRVLGKWTGVFGAGPRRDIEDSGREPCGKLMRGSSWNLDCVLEQDHTGDCHAHVFHILGDGACLCGVVPDPPDDQMHGIGTTDYVCTCPHGSGAMHTDPKCPALKR